MLLLKGCVKQTIPQKHELLTTQPKIRPQNHEKISMFLCTETLGMGPHHYLKCQISQQPETWTLDLAALLDMSRHV